MADEMRSFVDYLCLVYHEARNVRHLIRAGNLDAAPFEPLRSLPTNRCLAWEEMQWLRGKARAADSATAAAEVFANRFSLSLAQLVELYQDPHWRSSKYGGNPWAGIASCVNDLRSALDRADAQSTGELLTRIPEMSHNTGTIGHKLTGLRPQPDEAPNMTRTKLVHSQQVSLVKPSR